VAGHAHFRPGRTDKGGRIDGVGAKHKKEGRFFFFEKKKQKTFDY
jgi:hypothetical protein